MVDFNKVPFRKYSKSEIVEVAKNILNSIGSQEPIDIEVAIEKEGLDLIPLAGLKENHAIDAFLSMNKMAIYYDPDVVEVRIRFSLAHEFGHYLLHKEFIDKSQISTAEEWKVYVQQFPESIWAKIEYEANEFGAQILTPKENIENRIGDFSTQLLEVQAIYPNDVELVKEYLSRPLSRIFGVSAKVMLIRLNRENINPYDFIKK